MKYGYYPGCSLEKNAIAYHQSAMAATKPFGVEFVEIDDWNCCGATEYIALNLTAAYSLVARNLAIAEKQDNNGQVVAPCSACFLNLSKAAQYLADSPALNQKVNTALAAGGMHYDAGHLRVRHLIRYRRQRYWLRCHRRESHETAQRSAHRPVLRLSYCPSGFPGRL